MATLDVRPISYAEILGASNAAILLAAYSAECSIPEIGETNPQPEMYAQMERSGMFQSFGAFAGSELIGFASALDFMLPHYGRKIANVESLFVSPVYRTCRAGNALMNAIEAYGKEKDCEVISYSARTGSQFERLLSCLRPYQRTNAVFMRSLR
jgi:GNAT superfamily N-acetyltransferase